MNRKARKQEKEELLKYIERIRDENGNAVVDVALEGVALYDPLSMKGEKDLSGEIYDYIGAQTNVIPAEVPLRVRLHGDFSETEQEEIGECMHRHYTMKSFDISWDLIANFRKMLFLALFGAAVLAVYLFLAITGRNAFFTEVLSIVGSFSLWEAADAFLLERPHLRREFRNNEQNLSQKVEFVRDDEKPTPATAPAAPTVEKSAATEPASAPAAEITEKRTGPATHAAAKPGPGAPTP